MDKNETFIKAINDNRALIFKIAAVYTNSAEDRDDLVQDILYQLWRSFNSFEQRSALSTWMYRVAMNTAIYHLKTSKKRIQPVPLDEHGRDVHDPGNRDAEEKWELLKKHIDGLNLLDKGIVILYLENKTHEEIANIIGLSVTNVGTKLSRIKERLKQQIEKK